MGTETSAPSTVQSVERAIAILEILARSGEAGVTRIAAEIGVHKSTAFRLVSTLEQGGLVEQAEDRGKYRLGMGTVRLAGATTARLDVVREARPICRRLAAITGETINVAVLSDGAAFYLDQVAGASTLQAHNWVGQHIPLHATSNGKVLLSGHTDREIADLLGPMTRFTESTIRTPAQLLRAVATVRERGFATAVDELEVGLTAVAAPVRNAHGDVTAALSVSGPTFRLSGGRVDEILPPLVAAAREISHRLGWSEQSRDSA